MLKQLRMILNNRSKRTVAITAVSLLIMAGMLLFIELELEHNEQVTVSNYTKWQQEATEQAASKMQTYMKVQTQDTDALIGKLMKELKTEGSSYWFIAEDTTLLFVKNDAATPMYATLSLSDFIQSCKTNNMKVSVESFTYGSHQYTVGNCTRLSYIEDNGQLFRHHSYIMMPVILISALYFIFLLYGQLLVNRQENKIHQLNSEAKERNITIERLSSDIKKSGLEELKSEERQDYDGSVIYSREVLSSLLDKIGSERVKPLTIAVLEFTAAGQKMTPEEYHEVMQSLSALIEQEHVFAQLMPDIYAALVFYTTSEQNDSIKEALIHNWVIPLRERKIKVKVGISRIEDYDKDVKTIFDFVCTEVSKNRLSNAVENDNTDKRMDKG